MQDDDFSLFKSEMRGVKRISVDRADTGKPRNDRQQLKQRQLNASVRNDEIRVDGLSDQFVIDVGPRTSCPGPATASRKASCASSSRAWCPSTVASTCTA
ncbi:DNA mismatch repair protein MutS [Pseudomonas aeruginosa]|nr:DNA mismatch repair protein MutS [Pseudomonas aeruginosa]